MKITFHILHKLHFYRIKHLEVDDLSQQPKYLMSSYFSEEVYTTLHWASLVVQMVKNLPAVWETHIQFLGWEDPLEKGMATHSSILAWRIPW